MIDLLNEVQVFQLGPKHNEVESRFCLQLPGVRVDGVEELEGVGGAGDVAQLPVDLALDAGDVEEHVALGKVGRRGEGSQPQLVLDVDSGAALNRHVKHLQHRCKNEISCMPHISTSCVCYPHVVEDGQDVSDGASVDVLEVVIASLGKDESVALLLRNKKY